MKIRYLHGLLLPLLLVLLPPSGGCGRAGNGVSVNDAGGRAVVVADSSRIVAIGTAVAETVKMLGAADRVVGTDNASGEYMPEFAPLPKVGPKSTISAEGVLSLKPTVVLAAGDAGPPAVFDQIRSAGIAVVTLPPNYSVDAVKSWTLTIGKVLGADARAAELVTSIDADMKDVATLLARKTMTPKVIFVGRGPNMPNATMSGAGTTIDQMITLAGGANPFKDFDGFRPMTDEAVVAAQPDIIIMTEKSFERSGGLDGVLKFPGVGETPAGRNKRIVTVSDMYFQGFGPGVGRAVRDLAPKLLPELASSK